MTPRVEKRREILLLALDAGPKTTAELAKAAGVDRFVVRQDLVALEAAGLVEHVVTKSRSARGGAAMWARMADNRLRGAAMEAAAVARVNAFAAPRRARAVGGA